MDYRGRRVTVMGLGHFGGGAAAARWLARRGALVTVTDQADATALADALPLLADAPIHAMHLGSHWIEDFENAEMVVVNPAVRPGNRWLDVARRSNARLLTELELFLEQCPAAVVGVTGSNGKSTTAAMIAAILSQRSRTFLGGNLGGSLLEQAAEMTPNDWVVLEISSFQLGHFTPEVRWPRIAVATSCTPNHLDWHASFDDYVATKQRLVAEGPTGRSVVLNPLDAEVASWSRLVRGTLVEGPRLDDLPPLGVAGEHNRINAFCAAAAAVAAGCSREEIRCGLASFRGLPQRLEPVATVENRRFFNDSTATTPESTIAALRTVETPIWLLAGGKNKGFSFASLATETIERAKGAALFGAAREDLLSEVRKRDPDFPCAAFETLDEAIEWCWSRSSPGDAIVLSPACASTDQFQNFRRRGERFVELVGALERRSTHAAH